MKTLNKWVMVMIFYFILCDWVMIFFILCDWLTFVFIWVDFMFIALLIVSAYKHLEISIWMNFICIDIDLIA